MNGQYFVDNLDRALEEEWIKAYHQPLIRAVSGRVSNEEALARWEDPDGRVYTASDFVPVLDEAKLTYKLDLYMVERVLTKMKGQQEHGLFVVQESINLSNSDFYCCDMVREITWRLDVAGMPREKLSVEISEETIAMDMDYMKSQVESFRAEGIQVWMDDYGSGHYTSLLFLKMRFDALKIDKVFVDHIDKSREGQIIVTELVRTALALGMDIVAEGVETKAQAEFLKEIGCSKLQGYYFIQPVSLATIIERNVRGIQIGFENPEEADYYETLGSVNLYDFSVSKNDEKTLDNYFDTLPMVIFSLDDKKATFVRCNRSYRNFIDEIFPDSKASLDYLFEDIKPGVGYYSFNAVRKCAEDGKTVIIDDRTRDGRSLQLYIRRVAVNPVTKVSAVAIVLLSMSDIASSEGITYNYIARALSEDYLNLYFVDMDAETFAEYTADGESRDITFKKLGENFFDLTREEVEFKIYEEDKKALQKNFSKKNIENQLKKKGTFSMLSRFVIDGKLVYVNIKAVKIKGDGNFIVVGLNNVDSQVKDREAAERAKEEKIIYSRIGALTGDYIFIYTVDPRTLHYKKYNPTNIVTGMGIPDEGEHFFKEIISNAHLGMYHDDLDDFLSVFNRGNVLRTIEQKGIFEHIHRLIIGGEVTYVSMRATLVVEEDKELLIVGIFNIDERIKREKEYAENLKSAQKKATRDELTGVKNKQAYADAEDEMNRQIEKGELTDFAVAVFDLNGLKKINDTLGHQAGDEFIKRGCDSICRFFKHSPVYRVGGDEFVVIAQGYDFLNIDVIMDKFRKHNVRNQRKNDVVVAAGMSRFAGDAKVSTVFDRADYEMYKNKNELKKIEAE